MQSDFWFKSQSYDILRLLDYKTTLSGGDFSLYGSSINGWLRDLLWSESSQVLQINGTKSAPLGLLFLISHLIWSLGLMFLFSGRGYWQELIESLVWCHFKLRVTLNIQPRALSISQGRLVGVSHFIFGGVGCTRPFSLSRL